MGKLNLSFGCWDYDRISPLINGDVSVKGIELNWLNMPVEETFFRMTRYQEFDVAEMSLSSYLIAKDRGYPKFTALPVFMSRMFRHSGIYIHTQKGISKPEDLKGKKVGIPEYQLSACVWIRGFLRDDYDVSPSDLYWFTGGQETPGRVEKISIQYPPDIHVSRIPEDRTLNEMLDAGEIDAFIAPRAPSCFMKGSPNVARLFPNFVEVEQDYYKRTGIFPIMHVVVVKDEILQKHPWAAQNLYQAFVEAKQKVYENLRQTAALKVTLPWLLVEVEKTRHILGEDFWPYGLTENNRKTLEAFIRYAHQDGLISKPLKVEELFAKETLEAYAI